MISKAVASLTSAAATPSVLSAAVNDTHRPTVAIIGGGIGAFTAALSLHRAGIHNNLYVPENKLGHSARSALFIGGSAIRILDRLGLGTEFRLLGAPVHNAEIMSVRGNSIASFKLDGYGSQVWVVPRDLLLQSFADAVPLDSLHFSTKLRSLRVRRSVVQIELDRHSPFYSTPSIPSAIHALNNDPITTTTNANFVIGADGFTSLVRTFMSRPFLTLPSGITVWRAVVRHSAVDELPFHIAKEVWDAGFRFGYVRVSQSEVMWWAIVTNLEYVILRPFLPHLHRMFKNFPAPVRSLLDAVETDRQIYRQEMKHVWPQYSPWIDNSSLRIALVGDAARPGTPESFHTGNSFAVDDAYILANVLVEDRDRDATIQSGDVTDQESPLLRYEENRTAHLQTVRKLSMQTEKLARSRAIIQRYFTKQRLQRAIERVTADGMSSIIASSSSLQLVSDRRNSTKL